MNKENCLSTLNESPTVVFFPIPEMVRPRIDPCHTAIGIIDFIIIIMSLVEKKRLIDTEVPMESTFLE